jgi:hypothetical protein
MNDQPRVSEWLTLIEAEYREMPGLQLTEPQMRRLWGLDAATCTVIIATLVSAGILCETPKHGYALSATSTAFLTGA